MTSKLAQLQKDFQSYLLQGGEHMRAQISGTPKVSADERLEVYSSAYRLRLLEVLSKDYPGLHGLLGDEQFDRLGRAYIDAHPSQHPSLRWFGRHLSDLLVKTPQYAAQPVLAEMAAFEWVQGEVFDAKDIPVAGVDEVATIPPESWPAMRLVFQPAARRLDLKWNAPAIWKALDEEQTPPAPVQGDYPIGWLLWRKDLSIHWRSLAVEEAWAIDACLNGQDFGRLCEGLCEWIAEADAALYAAGLLKRWITDGLIARVEFA